MDKRSKKGFTLMELLIVVAIIAILIVISIPLFGGALNKAKQAADDANMRAAKAVYAVTEMTNGTPPNVGYYFDDESGTFKSGALPSGKWYGQSGKNAYIYVESAGKLKWDQRP